MSIKAPTRDIGQETAQTLKSQIDLAPQEYAATAQYSPLYSALDVKNFNDSLTGVNGQPGLLDIYANRIAPAMQQAQANSATGDVSTLERLGPRAVQAIQAANPQQQALLGELNRQAMGELSLGAKLDPSLAREVSQGVRAGQSARGLGLGSSDAAMEAMARGLQAEQLRNQRRAFAGQVLGYNQATSVDPAMVLLGRPAQGQQLLNQGTSGAQTASSNVGSEFNPMNPYAQDYWNTTYNARSAAKISGNNANAALWGQAIQTVGGLVGGLAGMCWVAREVYGNERDGSGELSWKVFREWMLNHAPKQFRTLYLTFGEQFAEFIKDKPELKKKVREFMDGAIANWRRERSEARARGDFELAKGEY